MNNRKFLDTLKEMKGKSFVYAKQTHTILDYSINDQRELVNIKTDKKLFERGYENVEEFLTYWDPIVEAQSEELTVVNDNSSAVSTEVVFQENNSLAKDLIEILRENIDKVRKDKNYIPQAQAINANVNSIINVTRMQLDVHKHFRPKKVS
jgi:hypothetical protein